MSREDLIFENEVRRIARLLWPSAEFGGAAMEDGRERDGVFEGNDFIHIIECTTSRAKKKAEDDYNKLDKLIRKLGPKHPTKFIKGWFITKNEPTADQRDVFKKNQGRIIPISYEQFRSKLVNSHSYLNLRKNYPFGSVRDPESGDAVTSLDYVDLDLLTQNSEIFSTRDLCEKITTGNRFLILGDYGAGKSATLREIHFLLARSHITGKSLQFPITINLRDHSGQTDPDEVLERHARKIGYPKPSDLVSAWRSGYAVLLLDGFDEIATAGWAGKTIRLRDLRYRSMEILRKFVKESPGESGLIIAGREHYFDGNKDLQRSLSLGGRFSKISISEFSDEQVKKYLENCGWNNPVPDWVPSRPLLLGYLASKGLLIEVLSIETGSSPASGWDVLIDRICAREAEIDAGIEPSTVRGLIEKVATFARESSDGLGPLTPDQIIQAFVETVGYSPDDRGAVLLQRLPGLGGHSSQEGARVFIDKDLAEAAKAGAIFNFIEDPYNAKMISDNWNSTLNMLGSSVVAKKCNDAGYKDGKISAAFQASERNPSLTGLLGDLLVVSLAMGVFPPEPSSTIKDIFFPELEFGEEGACCPNIQLVECLVGKLDLPHSVKAKGLPVFKSCHFGLIAGRSSKNDIPVSNFVDCSFDCFDEGAETTNAIMSMDEPIGTKVMLTILKKLFAQSGSGRRENALYRGLDPRSKDIVPKAIELLKKEGFVVKSKQGENTVWYPVKSSKIRTRALKMLSAPGSTKDPVFENSRNL